MEMERLKEIVAIKDGDDVVLIHPENRRWYFTNARGFELFSVSIRMPHLVSEYGPDEKDFLPIARKLASAGILVTLSTNGSLVTENIADALTEIPVETIAFSIHGSDAKSHDWFNEFPGAWDRLIAAIRMMVKRNVKVKLVMTITKPTALHAPKLLRLAHDWGVYMVQYQTFKHYGNASQNLLSLNLSSESWRRTFEAIQSAHRELSSLHSELKVDLGLDSDPMLAAEIGMPSAHKRCACGIYSATITPSGEVLPCSFVPESVGNLHHAQLSDIWQNSPLIKRIRACQKSPCGMD
jgi:MoaA/NifB/PqqE/SkfB family radical SAM enzyme